LGLSIPHETGLPVSPEYRSDLLADEPVTAATSWGGRLPVSEQMALPGSVTNPGMLTARFLLKPGRKYEDVVKSFQPDNETKEVNDKVAQMIKRALSATKGNMVGALIFINNRLEGNELNTIAAVLDPDAGRHGL
jgi:hypothetical protein